MYIHTHDKQHLNEFKYNSIANIEKTMTVYVFIFLFDARHSVSGDCREIGACLQVQCLVCCGQSKLIES